jgi:colanic acid/amylovoran biosynthesis glycosyltransferase
VILRLPEGHSSDCVSGSCSKPAEGATVRLAPTTAVFPILCIATHSCQAITETFIADHIRSLAPKATLLLCQDSSGTEELGFPVLTPICHWQPPRTFRERVVNAVRHRWRTYINPGLDTKDRRSLLAFFRTHQVAAVLAEYGPMGCLLRRACREAGVPLFVHFHGYDASMLLRDWHQRRHYRALFRDAAGIIAPSRSLSEKLTGLGCPAGKLHVSPYGIDAKRFTPTRRVPQQLVAVGRLVEKKAPHLTIQAFARIADRFPEARLDIVGDGPLADECRALICDLGLCERVQLRGAQSSGYVAQLLRGGALFVQHSITAQNGDTEGLPVAILEAMASALPVVSTRHSGIPEAVEEGVTGLLVNERDIKAMASAISDLLENPNRAAAMGVAGRKRVLAHFTQEQARDRLRAIMGFIPALMPVQP